MKNFTIYLSIILIVLTSVMFFPKNKIQTNEEWNEYLKWEEEFLRWRDGPAIEQCVYQIQHRDTHEVYFFGSLQECKDNIKHYELTQGECVVMPYLPL